MVVGVGGRETVSVSLLFNKQSELFLTSSARLNNFTIVCKIRSTLTVDSKLIQLCITIWRRKTASHESVTTGSEETASVGLSYRLGCTVH